MMIDFLIVTWTDVLTTLRVLLIVFLVLSVVFLTLVLFITIARAVSFAIFVQRVAGKIEKKNWSELAQFCLQQTWSNYPMNLDNGNYWGGVGDWRYFDTGKKEWIAGRNFKDRDDG